MTTHVEDELWSAMADPTRRRLLDLLLERGEASASTLAQDVPFTRQAVVKHLVVLEDAGLVSRHPSGRAVNFRVEPARLEKASRALDRVASQWDRRLLAIKELAEAHHEQRRPKPAPSRSGRRLGH